MVRYGELFLKSEPVKRHFIANLIRNIGKALESATITYHLEAHRGRILIYGDDPAGIAAVVSRVFGVVDVAVCIMAGSAVHDICREAMLHAERKLSPGMTFAVRARRQGVEGITSQELGAEVGAAVIGHLPWAKVDLRSPDYEIFIERREYGTLIYDNRIPAPGGLPWGTQGKVLTLLSAGIDSPVAAWLMMKRGCEVGTLHVDGGRFAGSDVRETAVAHHAILSRWCAGFPMELRIVDAGSFYEALTRSVPPRYRCVLCKRFMMRLGSAMVKSDGFEALVTGDSLGQVASQTLTNIATVSDAASVPVLRPLIAYDKEEVVRIARAIGTFDTRPGDLGCLAVPRMPATSALVEEVQVLEEAMDMASLVGRSVECVTLVTAMNGKITLS